MYALRPCPGRSEQPISAPLLGEPTLLGRQGIDFEAQPTHHPGTGVEDKSTQSTLPPRSTIDLLRAARGQPWSPDPAATARLDEIPCFMLESKEELQDWECLLRKILISAEAAGLDDGPLQSVTKTMLSDFSDCV